MILKTIKLGELFKVRSSKRVLKSQWKNKGVPFYRGREITSLSKFGYVDNDLYITREHYKKLSSEYGIPKAGDIMITAIGTIGNSYIVKENDEFYFKDASVLWLDKYKTVSSEYIDYWLKSDLFFTQLDKGFGATVDSLTISKLQSLEIKIPTLAEQQRIVAKLDAAFPEIDKTIEAAKRIDENAQALFETARNDVFISKDVMWKQNKLGNICNFLNGFAFKSTDAVDISNVQLLRMGNMYRNKLDLNRKPVFYPSQFSVDFSKYVILPGDIIMSLTGTVGKRDYGYAVRIGKMEKILLLNQRIVKLYEIDESQVNKDYFLFYLRSKDFLNVLYSTANGTRQANLSSETIKGLSIPICSINEQKKIVAKLSFLKEKTKYISDIQAKKIYNLKSLKSSMLINMFTIEKTNAA